MIMNQRSNQSVFLFDWQSHDQFLGTLAFFRVFDVHPSLPGPLLPHLALIKNQKKSDKFSNFSTFVLILKKGFSFACGPSSQAKFTKVSRIRLFFSLFPLNQAASKLIKITEKEKETPQPRNDFMPVKTLRTSFRGPRSFLDSTVFLGRYLLRAENRRFRTHRVQVQAELGFHIISLLPGLQMMFTG